MESFIKSVIWTNRAKKDLGKLINFYAKLYGEKKAKEIAYKIRNSSRVLENSEVNLVSIGAIDHEFSHLKHTYRKILKNQCKITYREGKTNIYIVRVFDTRQNPIKNR